MKFSGYNFGLIFVVFSVLISNKVMAQNIKKPAQGRVIYEQQMSYDDARKMQEIVEKLEKEKNEDGAAVTSNPLIDFMSNGSVEDSKMLDMLKILINAMGIDALPEDLAAQKVGLDTDNSDKSGVNNFKKWNDTHSWKKLRTEEK